MYNTILICKFIDFKKMKSLLTIINEKLQIKKSSNLFINDEDLIKTYKPQTKDELIDIISNFTEKYGDNVDLNIIDTSLITDMSNLFKNFSNFNGDVDLWDVSNVKDFNAMFKNCKNLNKMNLINWDVKKGKDFSDMFCNCKSLISIGDISNWNISKAKFMINMFDGCSSLKLDLSKWNFPEKCSTMYITNGAPNIKLVK